MKSEWCCEWLQDCEGDPISQTTPTPDKTIFDLVRAASTSPPRHPPSTPTPHLFSCKTTARPTEKLSDSRNVPDINKEGTFDIGASVVEIGNNAEIFVLHPPPPNPKFGCVINRAPAFTYSARSRASLLSSPFVGSMELVFGGGRLICRFNEIQSHQQGSGMKFDEQPHKTPWLGILSGRAFIIEHSPTPPITRIRKTQHQKNGNNVSDFLQLFFPKNQNARYFWSNLTSFFFAILVIGGVGECSIIKIRPDSRHCRGRE